MMMKGIIQVVRPKKKGIHEKVSFVIEQDVHLMILAVARFIVIAVSTVIIFELLFSNLELLRFSYSSLRPLQELRVNESIDDDETQKYVSQILLVPPAFSIYNSTTNNDTIAVQNTIAKNIHKNSLFLLFPESQHYGERITWKIVDDSSAGLPTLWKNLLLLRSVYSNDMDCNSPTPEIHVPGEAADKNVSRQQSNHATTEICDDTTIFDQGIEATFVWVRELAFPMKLSTMRRTWHGRGVAICVHDVYVRHALTAIYSLRRLGYRGGVFIAHCGKDLSEANIALFTEAPNVSVSDICEQVRGVTGWYLKAFAAVFAPFDEVVIADADILFAQSIEKFWKDPGYVRTGMLLFKDRIIAVSHRFPKQRHFFAHHMPPNLTKSTQELRIFQGHTAFELDSGVVLINKRRLFVELLTICALNHGALRDLVQSAFHGDKETFWLGMEYNYREFAYYPSIAGLLGEIGGHCAASLTPRQGCFRGHLSHFDSDGDKKLIWKQDGVTRNKKQANSPIKPVPFMCASECRTAPDWTTTPYERTSPEIIVLMEDLYAFYSNISLDSFIHVEPGNVAPYTSISYIFTGIKN